MFLKCSIQAIKWVAAHYTLYLVYSDVKTASVFVCKRTAAIQPAHVQTAPHSVLMALCVLTVETHLFLSAFNLQLECYNVSWYHEFKCFPCSKIAIAFLYKLEMVLEMADLTLNPYIWSHFSSKWTTTWKHLRRLII